MSWNIKKYFGTSIRYLRNGSKDVVVQQTDVHSKFTYWKVFVALWVWWQLHGLLVAVSFALCHRTSMRSHVDYENSRSEVIVELYEPMPQINRWCLNLFFERLNRTHNSISSSPRSKGVSAQYARSIPIKLCFYFWNEICFYPIFLLFAIL